MDDLGRNVTNSNEVARMGLLVLMRLLLVATFALLLKFKMKVKYCSSWANNSYVLVWESLRESLRFVFMTNRTMVAISPK